MPLDPSVRSLIALFRRSPNWNSQLDVEVLQRFWPDLVGGQLAAVTKVTAIHGATVVVNVPNKIWRKELLRMKGPLLAQINQPWGGRTITEIAITYEN
jgi:predicted nucleic acid-binding Zn ribbon protein